MITCGSLSRPSLQCPRFLQRREGQAAPALGRDVLVVAFEPGGGGVVEDQVDVELEQIDAVPEHLLLDRIAVLGQDVQGAIELVEGEILGRGQPDLIEPALDGRRAWSPAGPGAARSSPATPPRAVPAARRPPAGRRSPHRCRAGPTALRPRGRRRARSWPRSRSAGHVPSRRPRARRVGVEHPADAAHQSLQRGAVEAIGAAEAVHHLGLDVTLLGMADVLGQRVVADDRAVLVPALRGPKVHAHAYSVSGLPVDRNRPIRVPTDLAAQNASFSAKNPTKSMLRARPTGPNVPTDRKLRPGRCSLDPALGGLHDPTVGIGRVRLGLRIDLGRRRCWLATPVSLAGLGFLCGTGPQP